MFIDAENKELYLQAINNPHKKGTMNSKPSVEWDTRYNNIYEVANNLGLLPLKVHRSNLWEVMFVINIETKEIYAFMKEKTLKNVLKKDGLHYSKLLNQFNKAYDHLPVINYQPSLPLFEDEKYNYDELLKLAKDMISSSAITPEKFFIFAFNDYSFNKSIKAVAYNTHNELIFKKNLTDLLKSDYSTELDNDNVTPDKYPSPNKSKLPPENSKKNIKPPLVKLKAK